MLTSHTRPSTRPAHGFALIEAMVAIVIGLVVVGAALAFTVATMQSGGATVSASRLTQDLRATMGLVSRELRRAGFDARGIESVGRAPAYASPFAPIAVVEGASGCIVYAYDRDGGTPGTVEPANNELRAIRHTVVNGVGIVQMRTGAGTACDAAAGWENLSDPVLVNVQSFDVQMEPDLADLDADTNVVVRSISVSMNGALRDDASVSRALSTRIRVRADCLREPIDTCYGVPGA